MNKIRNTILILSIYLLGITSCKQPETPVKPDLLSKAGQDATAPYLTEDNEGNPVICWAEKDSKDSLFRLKYAVFNDAENRFGAAITVAGSEGLSTSPESMGKIAFKSDKTVIAVFAKSFPNEKNPFAGAILYTASADNGQSWYAPQFLHSDTSHSYGRSFFDITRIKNGEVAAVWLDGRFGKTIKGSALFYSVTGKDQGFGQDKCLHKGTCECCRTDLLQDDDGNLHVAYRSILFPSQMLGKQVRDMVYSFSKDNGATFSPPKVISKDNWAIEGCPHTGPSLAVNNKKVNVVWFTAGGNSGIYHTAAEDMGKSFQNRHLLSETAKHPQMIALENGKLAIVAEEIIEAAPVEHAKHGAHSMGKMAMTHQPGGKAKIVLQVLDDKGQRSIINISDGTSADHHAVLTEVSDKLLVSWVREENGKSGVYYTIAGDEL